MLQIISDLVVCATNFCLKPGFSGCSSTLSCRFQMVKGHRVSRAAKLPSGKSNKSTMVCYFEMLTNIRVRVILNKDSSWNQSSTIACCVLFSYLLFRLPSNLKSSTIPFTQLQTGSTEPQAPGMRTTDVSSPDISWLVQE